MKRTRNPFGLAFEDLVQPMQRDVGVAESAMRHLERREASTKNRSSPSEVRLRSPMLPSEASTAATACECMVAMSSTPMRRSTPDGPARRRARARLHRALRDIRGTPRDTACPGRCAPFTVTLTSVLRDTVRRAPAHGRCPFDAGENLVGDRLGFTVRNEISANSGWMPSVAMTTVSSGSIGSDFARRGGRRWPMTPPRSTT